MAPVLFLSFLYKTRQPRERAPLPLGFRTSFPSEKLLAKERRKAETFPAPSCSPWSLIRALAVSMPTRRHGGFRLGRKLLSVWRWALCHRRRRRGRGYLRLQPCHQAGDSSPSSTALIKHQQRDVVAAPALGSPPMLTSWGRSLARRGMRLLRHRGGATKDRLLDEPAEATTPKGKVAVYVGGGGESLRYVVPVVYFNHPLFGELLREAEEEFGFEHPGGITIPCAASRFERAAAMAAAGGGRKAPGGWW